MSSFINLQQRTPAWFKARAGKLTASNLAAYVCLNKYCTRDAAYDRLMGRCAFEGNDATRWGADNEQNGINAYQTRTGYMVDATGLWTHKSNLWLAGSPDGLVGNDGMIEVKCPFYKKVQHTEVPVYYYIQIIACLEMTNREWCDYICWTPENGCSMFRITRDSALFDFMLPFWGQVFSCLQRSVDKLPSLRPEQEQELRFRVDQSMAAHIDYTFYDRGPDSPDSPPCLSEHSATSELDDTAFLVVAPSAKRMRLSDA